MKVCTHQDNNVIHRSGQGENIVLFDKEMASNVGQNGSSRQIVVEDYVDPRAFSNQIEPAPQSYDRHAEQ